jgi:hypothetical protein
MTIFEVMWQLPASIAYQIYLAQLSADKGLVFVTGETDDQLLKRLQKCQT